MNLHYRDILSSVAAPPKWFDENAVPRFCDFAPDECADIYANECALVRIECQACEREFDVAISRDRASAGAFGVLADQIRSGFLGYGDPPNVECCPAGPTMSSETRRILQYWRRDRFDWVRVPELEIEVSDE